MIKESLHQEDVTILNAYATEISASNYMRQKLIELPEAMYNHMIIVRIFNISSSIIDQIENKDGYRFK